MARSKRASKRSPGVRLDGAQMLIAAITAGTLGFLKERGIPIREWVDYVGDAFEGSWSAFEGWGGDDIFRHVAALNAVPMGAEVMSLTQDGDTWEMELTTIPSADVLARFGTTPEELLEGFGLTADEFALIYGIFNAPARAIGLEFSHRLEGDRHTLRLEPKTRKKAIKRGRAGASPKLVTRPRKSSRGTTAAKPTARTAAKR